MLEKEKEKLIFGLDIGTRTIIGIVGYKQEDKFVLVDSEVAEHESRAMVDGQIHDIQAVSRTAKKVKENLEERVGIVLEDVSIAAAGRVLKTIEVTVSQEFEQAEHISNFAIKGLELQGIHKAKKEISNDNTDDIDSYLYVGHSVVSYYLNDYAIANLEDQKGQKIGADILATFLPKMVIESLYTVMDKIGLRVINITLEPIAAMNAVIPQKLRLLNLALVDIGAGTSDIAISKDGSVTAYGMIPLAGDEITEKLVHTYLVDFDTGENIKQQLTEESVEYTDVIGISHTIKAEDVNKLISDKIESLCQKIADKIIKLNGDKSPNAVFCVGGASQTPYITEILAKKLELDNERISVRSSRHASMVIDENNKVKGPESITPLGICLTTLVKQENDLMNVKVNDKLVELLHTKEMKIADAVIAAGIDYEDIISVRGKTLMFKLNGQRKRIKGEPGIQPQILRNNEGANLETPISEGDELTIHPAQNGKDGRVEMLDLVKKCGLNQDNAVIMVNNKLVDHKYIIRNGDEVIIRKEGIGEKKKNIIKEKKKIYVTVNEEIIEMPNKKDTIFVEIFDYFDFDLSKPRGNIVLKLNGKKAGYTDTLKDGDYIEVYWEQTT